jgi:18S rRNA (adenine1779-N6/adenine1780-N6)-dimethyltransferase
VEIGPGAGALTEYLCEAATQVLAIEIDTVMVAALQNNEGLADRLYTGQLTVLQADFLTVDLETLAPFQTIVGNIPYHISSKIVQKLLAHTCYDQALLLVQEEFADKLIAKPGSKQYSRISAYAQLLSIPTKRAKFPRHLFDPVPGVDSAVIHFESTAGAANVCAYRWNTFLRLCFGRPNKTLRAQLMGKLKSAISSSERDASLAVLETLLQGQGLVKQRPKKLSAQELYELMQRLEEEGLLDQLIRQGNLDA